jgi:hypothetical protein
MLEQLAGVNPLFEGAYANRAIKIDLDSVESVKFEGSDNNANHDSDDCNEKE